MSRGMKRNRSEGNEFDSEFPSKRLRQDLENSVAPRRSVIGRLWDVTSGHLRRAYTWLMRKLPVSSTTVRLAQTSQRFSEETVLTMVDDDDDLESSGAEAQKALSPRIPESEPPSVARVGDIANTEKHEVIIRQPATARQYSASKGGVLSHPVLSDVLYSQKMTHYEKLLETSSSSSSNLSTRPSIEDVGPAYKSTPPFDTVPSTTSSASHNSLLFSSGIRLLSVDSSRVFTSSSSRRRRLDWSAERTPSYSLAPQGVNILQPIPRTVTPTLSSTTHLPKTYPFWDDDHSLSRVVPPSVNSRTQSCKHPATGTSARDRERTICERDRERTASSFAASAVTSYPSQSSWLEQWKLKHEIDKADYRSRVEAAKKYYDIQHDQRMMAEDKRHKNLEGLLKSLQITRVSPRTEEEELNLNFTSEQLQQLKQVWTGTSMDQVLSEAFNIRITRADLMTLHNLEWLNDEVINFYLNMVVDQVNRQTQRKIHLFNSFFYTNIMSKGYSGVRRWTKRVPLPDDVIGVPELDDVLLATHSAVESAKVCYAGPQLEDSQRVVLDFL